MHSQKVVSQPIKKKCGEKNRIRQEKDLSFLFVCKEEKNTCDSRIQTDIERNENVHNQEAQTEEIDSTCVGTNTEDLELYTFENAVGIDENGIIHARDNESLIEMMFSHKAKGWDDIENYVKESLKMTLLGRPWLSNTGKHYMTIGFRTLAEDYESWRLRTLNWQDPDIRAVKSSRIYK